MINLPLRLERDIHEKISRQLSPTNSLCVSNIVWNSILSLTSLPIRNDISNECMYRVKKDLEVEGDKERLV